MFLLLFLLFILLLLPPILSSSTITSSPIPFFLVLGMEARPSHARQVLYH
jgi:hypothetical protein